MAKLIKITDSKAFRISVIQMADDKDKKKYISIRQMYKTKKEPNEWRPGYAGLTLDFDICIRIMKAMKAVFEDADQKVEIIPSKDKK